MEAESIKFTARAHRAHDFAAITVVPPSAEVLAIIEELRALHDVAAVETWTHFDLVKEDYVRALGPVA